ncbi:MAG: hypothetical protein JNM27_13850 [Leptospirales bacterium]|nr:hypothetical protein [Leptospirales bacterium]
MRNLKQYWPAMLLPMLIFAAACSSMGEARHRYLMKGSIIDSDSTTVYLCIGKKDGAQVGQELVVQKSEVTHTTPRATVYRLKRTGTVRITEIIDEHFARATVVSGSAAQGSIVHLE